jgi:hypothetical protein
MLDAIIGTETIGDASFERIETAPKELANPSEQRFIEIATKVQSLLTEPLLPDFMQDRLYRHFSQVTTSHNKDSNDFTTDAFAKGLHRDWKKRVKLSPAARERAMNQRILAEAITTILTPGFGCPEVIAGGLQWALNDAYNDLDTKDKIGLDDVESKTGSEHSIEYNEALLKALLD